jgi:hypothetical protein
LQFGASVVGRRAEAERAPDRLSSRSSRRIRQPDPHGEELLSASEDQNSVARSIAVNGMSDAEAGKNFIDANRQLVAKWLAGTGVRSAV